jgi:hypothetical protein
MFNSHRLRLANPLVKRRSWDTVRTVFRFFTMSLLRSAIPRQLGHNVSYPLALLSHQTLHTSAPTCKKYKPQKPFLMPGQTPGQQRAERKRLEAIQKVAKRFPGKDIPGSKPSRMGLSARSSSSAGDSDRFGMREGMGRVSVASTSEPKPSWDAEHERPRSPRPHLYHNRIDTSKPFVPRHLRPVKRHEPLDLDEGDGPFSSFDGRPERPDRDLTGSPMGVPLVTTRRRSETDFNSRRSPTSRPRSNSGSFGLSRSSGATDGGRSRSMVNRFETERGYATSASDRRDDQVIVTPSSLAIRTNESNKTKTKPLQNSSSGSEHDWRTPSPSDYARYDRMRALAKMGRGGNASGSTFPVRDSEGRNGRTDRPFTPRWTRDDDTVRPDETKRVGEREDDYSRPFRPARSSDSGRAYGGAVAGSSTMPAPFRTSSGRASTSESLASSSSTTMEDRPDSRWAPTKRLSRPAMQGIQDLHRQDPIKYSRAALSKGFGVSVEAISRILKSDGRWMKREVPEEPK